MNFAKDLLPSTVVAASSSALNSSALNFSALSRVLNPLLFAAGAGAIAYAGICAALYSYQGKLIFRPLPDLLRTPADIGLAYEDTWIPVDQGKLHAWWLPNPGSKRVLLFCHGNYGNISYNLDRIRFHHALGFSVLAFDYRGYGLSTSSASASVPNEKSTYADAEAAWQYLTTECQISPEQITTCGHSMGGAIAIHLAAQHPDMAHLIVKSSFTTMKDAVDAKKIYSLFPIEQMLQHPFDSLSKVKKLQVPVLYIHGEKDLDVPTEMSHRLFAATQGKKKIWIAAGADHNNITAVQGEAYAAVLSSFCIRKQLLCS